MKKMICLQQEEKMCLFCGFLSFIIYIWISLRWISEFGEMIQIKIIIYITVIYIYCVYIGICCFAIKFVVVDEKKITLRTVFKKLKSIEWKDVKTIEEVVINEKGGQNILLCF